MIHQATSAFGNCYHRLPSAIQQLANKNYELLKLDHDHPSLHFKKVGAYRSVRVGIAYRGTKGSVTVLSFVNIRSQNHFEIPFQEDRDGDYIVL